MRHYIIASHKKLSEGFYSALKEIIGDITNTSIITAYVEEVDLKEEVERVMSEIPMDREIVVFTDIYGGSVNNEFIKYLGKRQFHLIAGVNLPLIMTVMLSTEGFLDANKIVEMIEECRLGMRYCNLDLLEEAEEDDF